MEISLFVCTWADVFDVSADFRLRKIVVWFAFVFFLFFSFSPFAASRTFSPSDGYMFSLGKEKQKGSIIDYIDGLSFVFIWQSL